jgi:hypothetical protein
MKRLMVFLMVVAMVIGTAAVLRAADAPRAEHLGVANAQPLPDADLAQLRGMANQLPDPAVARLTIVSTEVIPVIYAPPTNHQTQGQQRTLAYS